MSVFSCSNNLTHSHPISHRTMPRSPSPPPRYRQDRRYRDDSPPRRYQEDRIRDRRWEDPRRDDFRGGYSRPRDDDYRRRDWDDRARGPVREYDRDPSPSYRRPPSDKAGSSRGSPMKTLQTPGGRSGTPEEGQITSPVPPSASKALPSRPRSPRSPLPFRRRSPSPPRRFGDKPFVRDRRGWEGRDSRDWERDRDRFRDDRPYSRFDRPDSRDRNDRFDRNDRDRFDRGDSRSRTPPSYNRRSPSPSSLLSRSRSSRLTSPRKISPNKRSPARRSSPPPLRRLPSPEPASTATAPAGPSETVSAPAPRESKPPPFAFTKPPPSGPRGDRAPPTGPRALSGGFQPRFSPYIAPPPKLEPVKIERRESPEPAEEKPTASVVNPYRTAAAATPLGPGGRLSWADRNSVSGPSTAPSPVDTKSPVTPVVHRQDSISSTIKAETVAGPGPFTEMHRVKQEAEDVKMEEVKPSNTDAEARIMEEIAHFPNRYGTAQWELDVSAALRTTIPQPADRQLEAHYQHSHTIAVQVNKAQSAARIAAAVLADAEAERAAAADRTRTVMDLLRAGDSWNMGIMGVSGM